MADITPLVAVLDRIRTTLSLTLDVLAVICIAVVADVCSK